MNKSLTLETDRLYLKKVDPDFFHHLFTNCGKEEIMSFFGFQDESSFIREQERFNSGATMYNRSFLNFVLVEKNSGVAIGACGYHTWYVPHHRAEIGYALHDEAFMRKGYMTEALSRIVHFGFKEMDLNRIEAFIGPTNTASQQLIQRLGFVREGVLRKHYYKNGLSEDSIAFGLLRDDFRIAFGMV